MPYHTPLMPSGSVEGRFTAAEEVAGGWYVQTNDSGVLRHGWSPRRVEEGRMGYSRESMESGYSRVSSTFSTYTPRRVESIVGLEDTMTYYNHQAGQRPAGGAHFEAPRQVMRPVMTYDDARFEYKRPSAESVRSIGSASSVSLHFTIPSRRPSVEIRPPSAAQQMAQPSQTVNTALLSTPAPTQKAGTSPLARKSFTRLATDEASSDAASRVSRRHSVAGGEERRGRRSVSVDRHGRRRLSKARPTKRSASQN
jgi:chitin synthase